MKPEFTTPPEPPELAGRLIAAWAGSRWNDPDAWEGGGSCLNATAIGIRVLARRLVIARPVICDINVMNREASVQLMDGFGVADWPVEAHSVGIYQRDGVSGEVDGHALIELPEGFIDLSVTQFSRPDRGIHVSEPIWVSKDSVTDSGMYLTGLGDEGICLVSNVVPMPARVQNARGFQIDGHSNSEVVDAIDAAMTAF